MSEAESSPPACKPMRTRRPRNTTPARLPSNCAAPSPPALTCHMVRSLVPSVHSVTAPAPGGGGGGSTAAAAAASSCPVAEDRLVDTRDKAQAGSLRSAERGNAPPTPWSKSTTVPWPAASGITGGSAVLVAYGGSGPSGLARLEPLLAKRGRGAEATPLSAAPAGAWLELGLAGTAAAVCGGLGGAAGVAGCVCCSSSEARPLAGRSQLREWRPGRASLRSTPLASLRPVSVKVLPPGLGRASGCWFRVGWLWFGCCSTQTSLPRRCCSSCAGQGHDSSVVWSAREN